MSTIGNNFTFGAAGTEDTLYGFSYANIKSAANESSDTDAFLVTGSLTGNLYYNAGSTTAPKYFKITDFTSSGGGVQIRLAGVFINNVKVNGTDAKVYWMPNGSDATFNPDGSVLSFGAATNTNGLTNAFTVQAVDNVDGSFGAGLSGSGAGNDTVSADTATAQINLTAVNDAPVIAGGPTASVSANENQTAVTTVSASDADLNALTYTLTGADASKFQINAGGILTFISAPNYEAPTDVGADNIYNVTVTANDGQSQPNSTTSQAITVTVANINDAPVNSVPAPQTADAARQVTFGSTLAVADEDVGNILTTIVSVLHGTFSATGTSGAAIGALGSSSLTISGTAAQVTAALNGLQYTGNVGFSSDTLTVTTTDANGGQDIDTVNIAPGVPSVLSVSVPANGAYNSDANLSFTVNFDQSVNVDGNPHLVLNVGGTPVSALYVSGSGTSSLVFSYNISPGDTDTDGIQITSLSLNGAIITNTAGANASLTLNGVPSTASIIIDTTAPVAGTLAFSGLDDTGSANTPVNTKDKSFDLTITGNEAGTITYEKMLNEGNWTATDAAQADLADGTYQFRAIVTDAAGNSSMTAPIMVIVDNVAPSINTLYFSNLVDSGSPDLSPVTTDKDFDLALFGCGNGDGAITYEKSLNGGTWTATGSAQTGLADGAYQFRAVTTDLAGNFTNSNTLSVTVDTVAPVAGTLAFSGLADTGSANTPVNTQDNAFDLSLSGNEPSTSVVYQVSVNNGLWATTTAFQSGLTDGAYSFRALVTDAAGNESITAPISMTVDTAAPEAGTLVFIGLDDTGTADEPVAITQTNTFSLGLTGNEGGAAVTYEISTDGGESWSETLATQSELEDGDYSFRAVVTDAAGNESITAPISMTVDNTDPTPAGLSLAVDSGAFAEDGVTNSGLINVTGLEEGATWEYSLNSGSWAAGSGNTIALVEDGSYDVTVRQTDKAGNLSMPSNMTVVLDTTAPQTVFSAVTYNAVNNMLTLTGTQIGDLLVDVDFYSDVFPNLDFSKIGWDTNGDGIVDFQLANYVEGAFAIDNQTLQIQLSNNFADMIEGSAGFGTSGGSSFDKLVILDGVATDLAGNVSTNDGATLQIMGPLNEAGIPMVYGADFVADSVDNETIGSLVAEQIGFSPFIGHPISIAQFEFNASVDTLHVMTGTSAADLDVFGTAIANNFPGGVILHEVTGEFVIALGGWDAGETGGIRNSSVVSFDDGSVLRTNSTEISATLSGGTHDDLLMAGSGGDRLLGNAGNDRLIGGAGNDQIYGGSGNDTLFGSGGSDYLVGGSGSDTFVFAGNAGEHASIADFSVAQDSLLFDTEYLATASDGDTLLTFAGTDATVRLLGVSIDSFVGVDINYTPVFMAGGVNVMNGFVPV